jgi:hypothetical protein
MIMQNLVALDIETVLSAAALDSSNSEGAATTDKAVTESKTVSARNIMMGGGMRNRRHYATDYIGLVGFQPSRFWSKIERKLSM